MTFMKERPLPLRALRGRRAEDAAVEHLRALGMCVLGRNVRVSRLELDIVARDRDAIVVVEVRARGPGAWARPLASLDPRKCERIRRAAAILWARSWSRMRGVSRVRFDVVTVDVGRAGQTRVRHVRAAFV
jgi:putative endonuclease